MRNFLCLLFWYTNNIINMADETFSVQHNQYLTSILGKSPKRKPLVRLTGTDVSARGRADYEDASFLLSYPCAGGGLLFTLCRSIFTICPISSPMCFACTVLLLDRRTCATENLRAMNLSEEETENSRQDPRKRVAFSRLDSQYGQFPR